MTIRVLLVEDNALNLELHRDLLEADGHEVIVCENAMEFRARIASGLVPDVVLMDILLPDGLGTTLLAELRSTSNLDDVPMIAITAHALAGDASRFIAAGFHAVITKPIDTRTFTADVARWARATSRKGE